MLASSTSSFFTREPCYSATETDVISHTITIINKLGLHARAAAKFVTLAAAYESDIQLQRGNRTVNGKSIMGVMLLAASKGTQVVIMASGGESWDDHSVD